MTRNEVELLGYMREIVALVRDSATDAGVYHRALSLQCRLMAAEKRGLTPAGFSVAATQVIR